MKKTVVSIMICVSILLSTFSLSFTSFAAEVGTTYYVDSVNGSNSADGLSPESAWATLAKVNERTYSEGDKILLKAGGIYTGPFVARGDGTKENPITLSSYGDVEKDGKPMIFTNRDVELIKIANVSGWTVENLELSAPNGRGIMIYADIKNQGMNDITVRNCDMHDIYFKDNPNAVMPDDRAPIFISSSTEGAIIDTVTVSDINIYNCGRGMAINSTNVEGNRNIFVSPEVSYNRNILIENTSLNTILHDGIIVSGFNVTVRNCSLINTCMKNYWHTAPCWLHHAKNVMIENCEIGGTQTNKDGMAVDFDGWTTDSTYQYIYSHDNNMFINNCLYDDTTKTANNTVRYCLSVNDNRYVNTLTCDNRSGAYDYTVDNDWPKYMDNFKFYNNTIINGSDFKMQRLSNAYVANNIFHADGIATIYTKTLSEDQNGKNTVRTFSGTFTNNCFYGYNIPPMAKKSITSDPAFVGTDLTDVNSFALSSKSKLIGKGVQVEEDMGEHDFYGNPLTDVHNIGCYEGSGEESTVKRPCLCFIKDFFVKIAACIVGLFMRISHFF